jgi:quinol monooxygenase YgiN
MSGIHAAAVQIASGTDIASAFAVVQVILKMTIDPRHATEIIRAFHALRLSIQSVEGQIRTQLLLDAESPRSLFYVEEWETPQDLGQDAAADHFTRMFGLMEKSENCPTLCVNSVSSTRGIEYLSSLLQSRGFRRGLEGTQDAST